MTIQNILDNCTQKQRDISAIADKFEGLDPSTVVNATCVNLFVAIDEAITPVVQSVVGDLI